MGVDFNDWQVWAITNKIHSDVVGYLTSNKMDLFNFDPELHQGLLLLRLGLLLVTVDPEGETIEDSKLHDLIAGTVGDGIATKFMAHRAISGKLPIPLISCQVKLKLFQEKAKEISAMFSLTTSLCYELKEFADKNKGKMDELYKMANNFFKFMMDNFETEMIVLGGRTALKVYKLQSPEKFCIEDFFKQYGKLIIEAHNA